MDYFTADLHFGHDNIMKPDYADRGAYLKRLLGGREPTIQEHDAWIIGNINTYVKPTDNLWILGDISFWKSAYYTLSLIEQLECKHIRLISGNHDSALLSVYQSCPLFEEVYPFHYEVKINKRKHVLAHSPVLDWNGAGHGSLMLHGHCHGGLDYERFGIDKYRIMDVGWDASIKTLGAYRPFSLEQIHERLMPKEHFPHHGEAT